MKRIRVLVVDDSLLFRNLLVQGLSEDPYIKVVAAVADPYEARDAIIQYRPDVMTLDIELPRMSGIDFLKKLMPQCPLPVVVISSLSNKVFDAMNAGAVDFVHKPMHMERDEIGEFLRNELITKIKIASTVKVGKLKRVEAYHITNTEELSNSNRVIAVGASTGGTEAIFQIVKELRKDMPGIVMVQHMPPGFTAMYAERLNNQCQVSVKEAKTGDRVLQGQILLAPGDKQMRLLKVNGDYQVECKTADKVNGHCPSVDVLFESVARAAGPQAIGVILTGMGGDGARGLLEMRDRGAATIGQDEASCIVYGMPKIAYDIGAVMYQLPLQMIPNKIYNILRNN